MDTVSRPIGDAIRAHIAGVCRSYIASQLAPRDALVVQFMAALVAQQAGQGDVAGELCDSEAGKRVLEHLRVLRERNRKAAQRMRAQHGVR
jgi:hypothetical protein